MAQENDPIEPQEPQEPTEPQEPPAEPEPPREPEPPQPAPQGAEPPQGGIDWKAQARKWEAQAKRDHDALKAAEADARAQLALKDGEIERLQAVSAIAQAKGVPAALLKGDTPEELEASADALLEFADARRAPFPADRGGSAAGSPAPPDPSTIKDPEARIAARAELIRSKQ